MRNFLKEYFKLSNLEQKGTIALVVLIIIIFLTPNFYKIFKKTTIENSNEFEKWIASFKLEEKDSSSNTFIAQNFAVENIENERKKTVQLFNFDPNTVSKNELEKLGLSEYVSNNIVNFRSKGGKFYKKEDIKKIYGLKDEDYSRIEKYIQIELPEKTDFTAKNEYENTKKPSYSPQPISINHADSAAFTTLKGIGPVYASRIIKYRNTLGGFVSTNQMLEVYGITDSLFQTLEPFFVMEKIDVKKININTADLNELKKHPYIGYNDALAIIKYREQNGTFNSTDDLNKLYSLSEATIEKIKPYITTE